MAYFLTLAFWIILLTCMLFPRTKYPKTTRTVDPKNKDKSKVPRMFTRREAIKYVIRKRTKS